MLILIPQDDDKNMNPPKGEGEEFKLEGEGDEFKPQDWTETRNLTPCVENCDVTVLPEPEKQNSNGKVVVELEEESIKKKVRKLEEESEKKRVRKLEEASVKKVKLKVFNFTDNHSCVVPRTSILCVINSDSNLSNVDNRWATNSSVCSS